MHPLLSLALALPVVAGTPRPAPEPTAGFSPESVEHDELTWFEGSFEELLADARRTKRVVFIDFWADW